MRLWISIAFLTALAGCNRSPSVALPASVPETQFLALGDSYTIGQSVAEADRWPVQLAAMLQGKGIDIGKPWIIARTGWTGDELSNGIDGARVAGTFKLVTLLIGVNNQFRGRSEEEFRGQMKSLVARSVGFTGGKANRVIVVSIPDWGATPFAEGRDRAAIGRQIDSFNAICREEAKAAGARFVDITPGSRRVAEDRTLVAADGLHPSGKLYRQWAEAVLPVAQDALTKQ